MNQELVEGRFAQTSRGFGFVIPDDDGEDIFIPAHDVGDAMNGDTVTAVVTQSSSETGKREGKIRRIVKRAHIEVVGELKKYSKQIFVLPDDRKLNTDIYIPKAKTMKASDGDKVVARITRYPKGRKSAEGEIIRILGRADTHDAQLLGVLEQFGVPYQWGEGVKEAAKKMPKTVSAEEYKDRRDFRGQKVITIDGEDTKDVDDAVFLESTQKGVRLYVHIVDVSHYVTEGSALDVNARARSTSVYMIDAVIPMLPKQLSNGICSLNEGVDRLCMTCIMDFNRDGDMTGSEITEGVIRVRHHMTYKQVHAILTGDETMRGEFADVVEMIERMNALSVQIDGRRERMGNIEFKTSEPKFRLDGDGVPVEILPSERNESTRLIENFMISANEAVATEYHRREVPFLYRVHEEPDQEKMFELSRILHSLGINVRFGANVTAGQFQKILKQVEGTDQEAFVTESVLRSMMRARYSTEALGHFGLASPYYSHFTSPIRRYADLQIHRIIKDVIHDRLDPSHYEEMLESVAREVSSNQRRADDCEREFQHLKKAQYMAAHIGEQYNGIISHITKFGIYVELPNTVEGMIRISEMQDDDYQLSDDGIAVIGNFHHRRFRIGDTVRIEVTAASVANRTVDFVLAE